MSDQGHNQLRSDIRNPDDWDACAPGELSKMVHRLDARDRSVRRRQVLNTALVSTLVFACFVLSLGSFMDTGNNHYGGIACSVCREHLADYQLHLVGEATMEDQQLLSSMQTHLEKCQFCKSRFNTLYPNQRLTQATQPVLMIALQPAWSVAPPVSPF